MDCVEGRTSNSSLVVKPRGDYKADIREGKHAAPESQHTNFFHLLCALVSSWPFEVGVEISTYASRMCSGMLDSTALMSPGPNPVAVRLCFGLVKPGPTGPVRVEIGAPVESLRSRGDEATAAAAMLSAGAEV